MQQTSWGPPPAGIAGCGIAGVAMAIAAVTVVTDPPGRIMAGIAATGALIAATVPPFDWREGGIESAEA